VAVLIGLWSPATASAEDVPFCPDWKTKAEQLFPEFLRLAPGKGDWIFNERGDFTQTGWLPDRDMAALQHFVAALKERGTTLAVVVPPPRGLIESEHVDAACFDPDKLDYPRLAEGYEVFIESLRESGVIVPNLLSAIRAARATSTFDFYYHRDIHWQPAGARIAAEALATEIRKAPVYADLPKVEFETRLDGGMTPRQSWIDSLNEACGFEKIYEPADRYVTQKRDGGEDAAAALLGEDVVPQAVLVGTSMSHRGDGGDANFGGFIQQALSVDLLNAAIAGGGLLTSMMSYLYSADFQATPPKLLIWEFRPFDPAGEKEIRQLLGAVAGPCGEDRAVLSRSVQLDRGRTVVLTLSEAEAAKLPANAYLDLSLSDDTVREFDYTVDYADLTRERISINLVRAQVSANHYFLELPQGQASALREIAVRPRSPATGTATVTLCPRPEPAL
jgi:alginate biosynthesis protein AlgX